MLATLLIRLAAWRTRRRLDRTVNAQVFRDLAEEIRTLARCAAMACPQGDLLGSVSTDLEQLSRTVDSPDFRRLSVEHRLLLRRGLIRSRQKLIDSLQDSARPGRFVQ